MLFEPEVKHRVGAAVHSLDPNLSRSRMEQAHELGRAIPQVLVRLTCWFALRFPARAGIGHCLKRTGLVDSPHRDAHLLTLSVSAFDQIF